MVQMAQLETNGIRSGVIKDYSPEVKAFLQTQQGAADAQAAADRAELVRQGRGFMRGAGNLAAAGADVFTLPINAAGAAVNGALRLPNAFGAGIPTLPFGQSLTPYSDALERSRAQQTYTPAEFAAARKQLQDALKKAR
jgi:hypothetical protein